MSSKKHLDGQGQARRRNNRRRAVHLSEFLRDDDEPTVQDPAPQADYQNTTENSIGTIPSTNLSASCVTVSPIVTPDTPTDEPKKVAQSPPPPPAPPTPVNVWQLSSGEKDPPQGAFMPDQKAFPGLGKQGKKCKPLGPVPEPNQGARSPDSSKARRVCHVLGNFLPESLLFEGAAGKDHAVASSQSSVRSAVDNWQDIKPASRSPPRKTILKRATSQQPKDTDNSQSEQNTKPEISHEPVADRSQHILQRKEQQKGPGSCSKKKLEVLSKPLIEFKAGEEYVVPKIPIKPKTSCIQTDSGTPLPANAEPAMNGKLPQKKEIQKEPQENLISSSKNPKIPGCFSEQIVALQPAIATNEPDPSAAVANNAVPAQDQQKELQNQELKSAENFFEKKQQEKSSQAPGEHKMYKTPYAKETQQTVAAVAVPTMERGPSQQKNYQHQNQKRFGNFTDKKLQREGPASSSNYKNSKNPYAKKAQPLVGFQASRSATHISFEPENRPPYAPTSTAPINAVNAVPAMPWGPPQQMMNRKPPQNTPRSFSESAVGGPSKRRMPNTPYAWERNPLVELQAGAVPSSPFSTPYQRQNLRGNQYLWLGNDYSALEEQYGEQAGGEWEAAGCPLPPIRRSSLNANAQEFRPMVREQEIEQEHRFPPGGGGPSEQLHESRLKRRRRAQRQNRSKKREQSEQVYGGQVVENYGPVQGQLPQQQAATQERRARPRAGYHLEQGHGENQRCFLYRALGIQRSQQREQQQWRQQYLQQQLLLHHQEQQQQQLRQQQQQQELQRQQQQQQEQQRQQQLQQQLRQQQQQRQHQQEQQQQLQLQHQQQLQQQLRQQQQRQQQLEQLLFHQQLCPFHQQQREQQLLQFQQQQQQQQQHLAAPVARRQLHQNNQVYPGYVAVPAAPTAYGHLRDTPVYVATPVYPAPAAIDYDYVSAPASLEYVTANPALDYVTAPAPLDYGAVPPTLEYVTPEYMTAPVTLEYVTAPATLDYGAVPAAPNSYPISVSVVYPYIWEME